MTGSARSREHEPAADAPSRAAAPETDEIFGSRYRRVRRIGTGGMADVYEVEHTTLGAHFAAKVLRPGRDVQENAVRRFVREARLLGKLRSEHIVRVTDLGGVDEERPYYVMELLDGQDLRALLEKTELSISRAVKIVADACEGVAVAHAAGLVHRDLKPENLFVTYRDSGEEVCKLLDFGVSKACVPTTTETGALIGTVTYMAPEQIESAGTVTARADVYALGAILYELLAGRPPHVADSVERLLFAILRADPEPVATYRTGVPAELDRVVLRALARDPASRFASVDELACALAPFGAAGELVTNRTRPAIERAARSPRTYVRPFVVALALGAGVSALAAFAQSYAVGPSRPTPGARDAPAVEPVSVAPVAPSATGTVAPATMAAPNSAPPPTSSPALAAASTPSASKRAAPAPRGTVSKHGVTPAAPSASAMVASARTGAPLPKIQFDLQNPYGR